MEAIPMAKLWSNSWLAAAFLLGAAPLAQAKPTRMPMPGSLNSVQGVVIFDGHSAQSRPVRGERLRSGQAIRTRRGKAELLLTPGSFLRIGDDSEVRLLSRSLENTSVKVVRGKALLDAQAGDRRDLTIIMDGTSTRIDKKGLYGFNARRETVGVLHGKATVYQGDSRVTLKNNHQLFIGGHPSLEIRKLNKRAFKSSPLYRWSKDRNRYENRAKRSVQEAIAQSGHWYGPGWYWSKFWGFYTYLPSAGWGYGPYFGPYNGAYIGPYYGPWGWNGWGWGWDDDDGDGV
jgi:hypothetical protein